MSLFWVLLLNWVWCAFELFGRGVAVATDVLMSVLGPTAEILSFASPKESIQRKGDPNAAYSLRSSLLAGVAERGFLPLRQRDASLHRPFGLFPPKAPVLGAAYGDNRSQKMKF
ncbi:hypothetical protein J0667_10975 [Methylomonas sp. WH-1]|uniref:hypothetical protein n=1 Tax=unclassified Methylomonas TaxID=2608980 RepID=UPI00051B5F1F|nr:hypothetical protein [Methylomonas sp. LW13]